MPADSISLYAAGSLRRALTEIAARFETSSGHPVETAFGPSGLLCDQIRGGARADVFASANIEHPAALAAEGRAEPVRVFARNTLCALVRPGLAVTPENLLDRMLDPDIKLGTSTPKADPSGDYAFAVFDRAEVLSAGAREILSRRALQLTGNTTAPPPAHGRSTYGALVAAGKADIFLTYRTNALVAQKENPDQRIVPLPPDLLVGADYGMTILEGAGTNARSLAGFILSSNGQDILSQHGFAPPL
jgi:ABC-type molybdate transport system substrate-binding protein